MAFLTHLDIYRIRNIGQATLSGLQRFNLITGANGSGKTSILEAIYLLGLGRSFRSTNVRPVITRGEDNCVVSGQITLEDGSERRLGIQRDSRGGVTAKADGACLEAVAQLAQTLPLQLIDPESFGLLSGGPKARRRFMDWGVFHVEHGFLVHWQRLQKALRQRNSVLRHGRMTDRELAPWTRELVAAATVVDESRRRYLDVFLPVFEELLAKLFPGHGVKVSYYPGWDNTFEYAEVLDRGLERDSAEGYTHQGPQRADLRLRAGSGAASDILSRGQQKMLVCTLKIAQGLLLARAVDRHCVYLVDDLPAELDQDHREAVIKALDEVGAQVIFTAVEEGSIRPLLGPFEKEVTMFHVEHGQLSAGGVPISQ